MRGWQRPTRVAIGLFIIVFGATVFFAVRERAPVEDPSLNEQLEPDAVMESTEAVVTQAKGDVRDMTVEAERQLTYEDGSTRLVTVRVAVERGEADRNFVITGKEAVIGQDTKTIVLFPEVTLESESEQGPPVVKVPDSFELTIKLGVLSLVKGFAP